MPAQVREEAGVTLSQVFYHSSQPWPNGPSPQLMNGAIAIAEREDISVDTDELDDARWFSRAEAAAAIRAAERAPANNPAAGVEPGALWVPPPMSIAHQLVRAWSIEMA